VCRFSINYCGFRLTLLFHAACISLTILSALSFRPIKAGADNGVYNKAFVEAEGGKKEEINNEKEDNIKKNPDKHKSKPLFGFIRVPNINQIFIWKVLKNPLFLVLTFSVIT